MKKQKKIDGVQIGAVGQRWNILMDGLWYTTSPVLSYYTVGGQILIETENSVYCSKEKKIATSINLRSDGRAEVLYKGQIYLTSKVKSSVATLDGIIKEIRTENTVYVAA